MLLIASPPETDICPIFSDVKIVLLIRLLRGQFSTGLLHGSVFCKRRYALCIIFSRMFVW